MYFTYISIKVKILALLLVSSVIRNSSDMKKYKDLHFYYKDF